MPKIRRAHSLSLVKSRASPYAVSPSHTESSRNVSSVEADQNREEWEQARCPICMEHPHNAVLLKCSSHDRGCRPYMCNTSYRHSNCFEQFCKLYGPIPLVTQLQEIPFTSVASHRQMDECSPAVQNGLGGNQLASELICPLCRCGIYGYMVVEPARQDMNSKVRSCSSETCDFSGTYSELRKHSRSEHPFVRPSEVDPVRHHDWVRLQRERDFEDVLSLVQSDYVENANGDEDLSFTMAGRFWMSSSVSEMYDSLMDLLSDDMLDALRDLESLQERMENAQRDMASNFSSEVVNNLSLETRPYSQHAQPQDFRSSQHMLRSTQLRWQNQRQRSVESTSRSRQLRWRSQTSFGRHQRSFESVLHTPQPRGQHGSVSKSVRPTSQLRWQNKRLRRNKRRSSSSNHNER